MVPCSFSCDGEECLICGGQGLTEPERKPMYVESVQSPYKSPEKWESIRRVPSRPPAFDPAEWDVELTPAAPPTAPKTQTEKPTPIYAPTPKTVEESLRLSKPERLRRLKVALVDFLFERADFEVGYSAPDEFADLFWDARAWLAESGWKCESNRAPDWEDFWDIQPAGGDSC